MIFILGSRHDPEVREALKVASQDKIAELEGDCCRAIVSKEDVSVIMDLGRRVAIVVIPRGMSTKEAYSVLSGIDALGGLGVAKPFRKCLESIAKRYIHRPR